MHHDLLANVVNALRPDPAKVFLTGPGRSLTRVAFLARVAPRQRQLQSASIEAGSRILVLSTPDVTF